MPSKMERRPQKIADWLDAGNPLPPSVAGLIQAFLEERGIAFGADGISVTQDGTVVVGDTDASTQKLVANLDAIDPETLDPRTIRRAALRADLDAALADIRAKPGQLRSPEGRALLALAELEDLAADEDGSGPGRSETAPIGQAKP